MTALQFDLALAALLFCVGFAGVLIRRNVILALIGVEFMLNAANLNFMAFWRHGSQAGSMNGMMFVVFSIAVAAAEAAVGLALVIALYRHLRTARMDQMNTLKEGSQHSDVERH